MDLYVTNNSMDQLLIAHNFTLPNTVRSDVVENIFCVGVSTTSVNHS